MQTIVEKVFVHAKLKPEHIAFVIENESVSYGELKKRIIQCAQYFTALGLQPGDRIIVQGCYYSEFVISALAAHLCHAVFVPIAKMSTQESVHTTAVQLNAKMTVTEFAIEPKGLTKHIHFSDIKTFPHFLPENEEFTYPDPDEVADILFTTGSTGTPKGVQLTHKSHVVSAEMRLREFQIRPDNVGITLVPLNHNAPLRELYLNLYNGSTFIFLDGIMRLKKMFAYMKQYHVTSIYIPPANITILSQLTKDRISEYSNQLEFVYVASAPMQTEQQEFLRRTLPSVRLYFGYGSSENGSISLLRFDRDTKAINCCGTPCPGVDIRILDDDFNQCPVGKSGMIAIKSNMNMKGYYNMPEINEKVFHDGFFISNDIGYFDEEGFLYICGRNDDVINVGGLKVHPSEIESVVMNIDGIMDCICFQVSDPMSGQATKLLIKTDDEFSLSVSDVTNYLSAFLEPYKIPKTIEIVDHIARTDNGKLDRKAYIV